MLDSTKVTFLTQANLWLHGVAYIAMGATGFLNPVTKLTRLGFTVPATALGTFRVIYGGLMIGIALIFIAAAVMKGTQKFGLVAIILVMTSLILARTTSAILDRSFEPGQFLWSGIELAVIVVSVVLFRAHVPSP